MRLNPEEHPMMLAEPSHNDKAAREKMAEIMFEKYNVPGESSTCARVWPDFEAFHSISSLACSNLHCQRCCVDFICSREANFSCHRCWT